MVRRRPFLRFLRVRKVEQRGEDQVHVAPFVGYKRSTDLAANLARQVAADLLVVSLSGRKNH